MVAIRRESRVGIAFLIRFAFRTILRFAFGARSFRFAFGARSFRFAFGAGLPELLRV